MKSNRVYNNGPEMKHISRILFVLILLIASLSACGDSSATQATATLNPFNAPITPQPTPSSTAAAGNIPSLSYTGAHEFKVSTQATTDTLNNLNIETTVVGTFSGTSISFYTTQDTNDKVEEYYRKLMISDGWTPFKRLADENSTMLVYQKNASKIVLQVSKIRSVDTLIDDFKNNLKQGDTLILTALGDVKAAASTKATIELDNGGIITAELYPDLAPKTVDNFAQLAAQKFYDGLTFHRVEPGFVVQGGDPKGDGTGGPGYTIQGEFATNTGYTVPAGLENKAKHVYGTLAMARSSDPNSAGSQFYIVTGKETDASVASLNGKYAVFGKVTLGMDLVEKIQKGDQIKTITVQ